MSVPAPFVWRCLSGSTVAPFPHPAHRWGRGLARRFRPKFVFPVGSLFRLRVSHHLGRATFPAPASSNAACGFPALRSPVCFASRFMGPLGLRLDVYPPPQVLQIDGRLYHLVLAFPYVGGVANGRAPWLRGHYSASSLQRFLAGTRRASPVARHVLVTVLSLPPRQGNQPYRSVFGWSFCLRLSVAGSALGDIHFRSHNAFT